MGLFKKTAFVKGQSGVTGGLSELQDMDVVPKGSKGGGQDWPALLSDGSVNPYPTTMDALRAVNSRGSNDIVK